MIRKLKIRFIALSMTALIVLLIFIIAGMNIISYNAVISEADLTLSILSQNKGRFPDMDNKEGSDNHRGKPLPHGMSPELPYESRYFSVLLGKSGEVILTETSKIASVDSDSAVQYAQSVINQNDIKGFIGDFRFTRYNDNGNTCIIFLDCERKLSSFRTFLYASLVMTLVGIIVVFTVICFFSGKIIHPIAESYEKQKRFITDAGHEIKTPLTIINANVDILEMELGENECITDIKQQTERLKSLTDGLVMLARMEESEETMTKIEFPLSEVVTESANPFQKLAIQQNKKFICTIQPMLSIKGNDQSIQKLVSILMDNAFKYSPKGGTIILNLEKQGKMICLSVYNTTNTKIEQDSIAHVFDRFYRTDASRNSETGGHGIGLSIAKSIVSAHNGKIRALSQDEYSFQIIVSIPV
ncbi:MAG: sensor histidine kinase [Coprococcus sp.]